MADEFIFDAEEGHYAPRGRPSVAPAPELKGVSPAPSPLSDISAFHKVLSACVGSLITCLVVTPLDLVKTRLQSQTLPASQESHFIKHVFAPTLPSPKRSGAPKLYSAHRFSWPSVVATDLRFNGTWDGITKIVKHEGVKSLWRGLSPTLMMSIPSTVIYFVGYDMLREWTRSTALLQQDTLNLMPFATGAFARTMSATVISPLELIRTRMQQSGAAGEQTLGWVLSDLRGTVQASGVRTLWRGLSPTLWRDVPFSGLYWYGYEEIRRTMTYYFDEHPHALPSRQQDFVRSFTAGALSGMFAAMITTPFDVAKTRRQMTQYQASTKTKVLPASTPAILRDIVRQEGWRGLTKGLTARVAKVAPACAIMISAYETGKHVFAR